jgi:isochorismate pyruvate lyase
MKTPQECSTIEEIRKGIDNIDRQIIELLGQRAEYVNEIIRFKSNKEEVEAKKRYDEVLRMRRQWATEQNLSPDIIETIYKVLIQHFIDIQIRLLHEKKNRI